MIKSLEVKSPLLGVFVLSAVGLFIVTAVCMVAFTVNRLKNSDKLIQAQIEVYEAQAEQVGKPTIIRQEYISPMKGQ